MAISLYGLSMLVRLLLIAVPIMLPTALHAVLFDSQFGAARAM